MARGPYVTTPRLNRLEIREKRIEAGLTQEGLAELLDTSQATVARWERGEVDFSISRLIQIADALHCHAGALITDGDGLSPDERELVAFLRQHPQDAKILMSTYRAMADGKKGEEAA